MSQLLRAISDLDGLAATHELYARGFGRGILRKAVHDGHIIRVRQGWYSNPSTDASLVQAARVGGRLTCVSSAALLGLAVRSSPRLHVAVRPNSARLRDPLRYFRRLRDDSNVRAHWTDDANDRGSRFSVGIVGALRQMAFCQSPERVVAAADSALRLGVLDRMSWHATLAPLPARLAALLAEVDPRSESITESIVRFRLARLGVPTALQVAIPGVGRVDFLIGTKLVIEVDGFTYHSDHARLNPTDVEMHG